jgi:mannose-6-phosphate isomerase class I
VRIDENQRLNKNNGIELARLVIDADVDTHQTDYCSVKGAVVIHYIEGEITLKTSDATKSIEKGQLVFLNGDTEHALVGVKKSVVLLTIVLSQN